MIGIVKKNRPIYLNNTYICKVPFKKINMNLNILPKVDSTKISIELDNCTYISPALTDYFTTQKINVNTGEVITSDEQKTEPFKHYLDCGTLVKIDIGSQITTEGNKLFLNVLLNSKHLGKDYFKGITKHTLKQLYDTFISFNIFKCSYDDFANARYQDTDIAFDFNCTKENLEVLKKNIKASTLTPHHWHLVTKKDSSGIYAGTEKKPRENATNKIPYIKFYSKELDFQNKSNIFAKYYNLIEQSINVVRFEATIKNSSHKRALKIISINTFEKLLNFDLQLIAIPMFKCYFEKRKFINTKTITPMDKCIIDCINTMIRLGCSKQYIFSIFDRTDVSAKSNYNLVKKYHALYANDLINKETLEANDLSKSIFEYFGIETQTKLKL